MNQANTLHLGLIGDNIARSRSPRLHRLAGVQNDIAVTYDRLVPKDLDETFDQVFARCLTGGYRGINVTYPYKELVTKGLRIDDPLVRAIGAVNTVIFEADGPRGHNTDYSGFKAAYDRVRGGADTGPVLMIGTGGVGRAVAFGLVALGTRELRLVDRDAAKAEALAEALTAAAPDMKVTIWVDAEKAASGVSGLINCTPVGMVGYGGTPLPRSSMTGSEWVFDAVYTPADTQFLTDAAAEGLTVISGWELFFYQGVHAWALFSGTPLDETALRADLSSNEEIT
ncbi:shikimate dehydrogenase family protein [Puniceibacterium sediminis]|uniref:Shikimate dehydrogenase n=1 Tax=Puniceibacterium sediminis TaxID=1608407 RepID=A0A238X7K5_9RHOB|nr:shikimate dehydrogenase [Puniceibacterium sediminis]SNR54598.1 shikimate dehydrogenase [Puniceibacterium sediminis]